MKLILKTFLLFAPFSAASAVAQTNTPNTPFQHVIVLIQENRTPDNLFGSDAFASQKQLPGADLAQGGLCVQAPYIVTLQPTSLGTSCDPNHEHKQAWVPTWANGAMNGACTITNQGCSGSYPEYTYAKASDVSPYFQLAQQYGYANYAFQTNQGPSFPAHQFLLSGTSAPDQVGDPNDGCGTNCYYHEWFAAENDPGTSLYGCPAKGKQVEQIKPGGGESYGYGNGYPCYNHPTLVTLLESPPSPLQMISWKYYSHATTLSGPPDTSLWTAPNAIFGICGENNGNPCDGPDWKKYVAGVFPNSSNYPNSYSPILTDLGADPGQPQCALPGVSWVVPDGNWSDHGGEDSSGAGPSWIAAIVNAVGQSTCKNPDGTSYWNTTAILIVWDDWGGWYDHVPPWHCSMSTGICTGYNDNESGEYIYGFRVPLLVVSAYTGTYNSGNGTWSGYISGACGTGFPPCPNEAPGLVHDFGSILNFIEYAFGVNKKSIGEIYQTYHYADYYAPDGPNVSSCNPTTCPYSLSDFFPNNFKNPVRTFTPITQPIPTYCFLYPYAAQCWGPTFQPADPDSDYIDQD